MGPPKLFSIDWPLKVGLVENLEMLGQVLVLSCTLEPTLSFAGSEKQSNDNNIDRLQTI